MPTIYEIADHILSQSPYGLTNKELQKLLYLAQGFHLAKVGGPLFSEELHAWQHGPVHSGIWHKYKNLGYQLIDRPSAATLTQLPAPTVAYIAAVVLAFGSIGQQTLIEYSHLDMPWAAKYSPGENALLDKDLIRGYFSSFESFEMYKALAKAKYEFKKLLVSRCSYLRTLPAIGDDWISGTSVAPDQESCETAYNFLSGYEKFLFATSPVPRLPKMILGPIPSGGVSIELHGANSLYLNFRNNKTVEVESETGGQFNDYETSHSEFQNFHQQLYKFV